MSLHPEAELLERLAGLTGDERARIVQHLDGCPTCRSIVSQQDPSALFSLLSLEPLPRDALDRLSASVAASLPDVMAARPRFVRHWAAALAASVLLAAFFVGSLLRDAPPVERVELPPVPEIALPDAPERGIELLSSPGTAQLVDFTVGETQVVRIFDEELDI
jgi:hypothetical protein